MSDQDQVDAYWIMLCWHNVCWLVSIVNKLYLRGMYNIWNDQFWGQSDLFYIISWLLSRNILIFALIYNSEGMDAYCFLHVQLYIYYVSYSSSIVTCLEETTVNTAQISGTPYFCLYNYDSSLYIITGWTINGLYMKQHI